MSTVPWLESPFLIFADPSFPLLITIILLLIITWIILWYRTK